MLSSIPFVVVDLETTGGSARFDRVIEVAAVRVRNGVVEERFEKLVEPETPIPWFVTRLTGINAALVRGKPSLDYLLPDLQRIMSGAVLVAHNVSFDANFLLNAFQRAGLSWSGSSDQLCTLRLARRLVPGLHSYKLDSLCAFLGFSYVQQHRAGPDAEATASLLGHLLEQAASRGVESLGELLRLQRQPLGIRRRKGRVDEAQLASLPRGPGVYLLKDDRGQVVYVGKSVNVRGRVRQHLRPRGTACSPSQPRLRRRLPHVADVEAIETGSELEALLLESKLVKRYLPAANSQLRDYRDYPFIKLDLRERHPRLVATRERPKDGALYFGPFRRAAMVSSAVAFLSEQLGLRQCSGPLKPGQPACALLEMGRCLGPCVGAVSDDDYRAAADLADQVLRGQDRGLLARAGERRDRLAEQLRFEEAAEWRDRIRDLELVVGVQERLEAFAERNAAIVVADAQPGMARLLLVRGGRLVEEVAVPVDASPARLRRLVLRAFAGEREPMLSRDELDDVLILDSWLRRNRERAREVPVDPAAPTAAVPAVREMLGTFTPVEALAS